MQGVDGSNLPPVPNVGTVDATVEGIDNNKNGIRDDVELEIFERYPGEENIEIRAALLQYAMALQTELVDVMDSETWVAATQEIGRAFSCVYKAEDKKLDRAYEQADNISSLIRNTTKRGEHYEYVSEFQSSFTVHQGEGCDISF